MSIFQNASYTVLTDVKRYKRYYWKAFHNYLRSYGWHLTSTLAGSISELISCTRHSKSEALWASQVPDFLDNRVLSWHPLTFCKPRVLSSVFSSVTQSYLTLCNPMDCSTPGLPVYHQLPKFTQTHVHWVNDAIQPSHPLSSLSLPAFNLFNLLETSRLFRILDLAKVK